MPGKIAHRVGLALLVAQLSTIASAQPARNWDAAATEAFRAAWQAGLDWQPPSGVVFRWRREMFATMTAAELAAREAELAPTPEHPDWQLVRHERRLLDEGPIVSEQQVWWDGPGSFRRNTDSPSTIAMPYVDFVVAREATFCLNSVQLTVLDPEAPPPPGRDFASQEGEIVWTLWLFAQGGLGALAYREGQVVGARGDGQLLDAQVTLGETGHLDVRMTMASGRASRVLELARFRPPSGSGPVQTFRFGSPVAGAVSGPIAPAPASTIERFDRQGRLMERLTWLDARPMDRTEFAAVTTIPEIDGSDAVRGPVTFTSVFDFRSGVISDTAGGALAQTPIPNFVPLARPAGWMSWVTWLVAGLLVGVLVVVKVRQRGGTAPRNGGSS